VVGEEVVPVVVEVAGVDCVDREVVEMPAGFCTDTV